MNFLFEKVYFLKFAYSFQRPYPWGQAVETFKKNLFILK